jgi:hypothetical protein
MQKHLENVSKGGSLVQKKRLAQQNGSTIREPLIPIFLDHVMLPVLHIFWGLLKCFGITS